MVAKQQGHCRQKSDLQAKSHGSKPLSHSGSYAPWSNLQNYLLKARKQARGRVRNFRAVRMKHAFSTG
jgi:hypothetical protein